MQTGEKPNRKVAQGAATRAAILEVARKLFGERGFAATSIEDLIGAANITRGALYHHFRDKEDLFRAVYEMIARQAFERIIRAAEPAAGDLWERLRRGRAAFLDSWMDPANCRIVLVDGPSVLGPAEMRATQQKLEQEYLGGTFLRVSFDMLNRAGRIGPTSRAIERLLSGAFDAAALEIAQASDRHKARQEFGEALDWLIDAVRAHAAPSRTHHKKHTNSR